MLKTGTIKFNSALSFVTTACLLLVPFICCCCCCCCCCLLWLLLFLATGVTVLAIVVCCPLHPGSSQVIGFEKRAHSAQSFNLCSNSRACTYISNTNLNFKRAYLSNGRSYRHKTKCNRKLTSCTLIQHDQLKIDVVLQSGCNGIQQSHAVCKSA